MLNINPYADPREIDLYGPKAHCKLQSKLSKVTQVQALLWDSRQTVLPEKSLIRFVEAYSLMEQDYFCPTVNLTNLQHTVVPICEMDICLTADTLYQVVTQYDIIELTSSSMLLTEDGPMYLDEIVNNKLPVGFIQMKQHYYTDSKLSIEYKPIRTINQGIGKPVVSITAWDAYNKLDDDLCLLTKTGMILL